MLDRNRHLDGRFAPEYHAEASLTLTAPAPVVEPQNAPPSPLEALRRDKAKELWRKFDIDEAQILAFHADTSSYMPGTVDHAGNVTWWAEQLGIEPERAAYIERKMRQADGRPTARDVPVLHSRFQEISRSMSTMDPGSPAYADLSARRHRYSAEISAERVRSIALGIEEQWPHATHLVTRTVHDGYTWANTVDLYNSVGAKIWLTGQENTNGARQLAHFRTARSRRDIEASPFRTVVEIDDPSRSVRYNLHRMQDVLAADLL